MKTSKRTNPHVYEFRFLAVCESAQIKKGGINASLIDIVNNLVFTSFPCDKTLYAVVSLISTPDKWGKPLDLMRWQLGKDGNRHALPGGSGTPLVIPNETYGACCIPYSIEIPFHAPGFYGFDLFDRDGVFGEKENLLSSFLFSVMKE